MRALRWLSLVLTAEPIGLASLRTSGPALRRAAHLLSGRVQ